VAPTVRLTARNVHDRLAKKVDGDVLFVLVAMTEEIAQLRSENKMLAQAVTSVATGLEQMTGIMEDTDKRLERMRREDLDDKTSPYVTAEDPNNNE